MTSSSSGSAATTTSSSPTGTPVRCFSTSTTRPRRCSSAIRLPHAGSAHAPVRVPRGEQPSGVLVQRQPMAHLHRRGLLAVPHDFEMHDGTERRAVRCRRLGSRPRSTASRTARSPARLSSADGAASQPGQRRARRGRRGAVSSPRLRHPGSAWGGEDRRLLEGRMLLLHEDRRRPGPRLRRRDRRTEPRGTRTGLLPDAFFCGGQGHDYDEQVPAICIGHRAMHLMFNDAPAYDGPDGTGHPGRDRRGALPRHHRVRRLGLRATPRRDRARPPDHRLVRGSGGIGRELRRGLRHVVCSRGEDVRARA